MSRCFPFPPPGYVKKGTTNDADLLKKEKHREKKHKKEKKESKDKRKKEKSEGNDREKKDKRGDKEKDKDGDKVKYKNSITVEDEKKLAWKPVVHTGEILNGFSNDGGKVFEDTRNQDNHHLVKDTVASKYVQDLGRKVGYEEKEPVQKFTGADQKKEDKTVFELVTKDLSNGPEAKVKNVGRPGSKVMSESNGNTMLPIFPGIFDGKTDLISKSIGSKAEGKTKTTKKERHREKKSKGKDKNSEKKEVKYDEMTREQDNPKVEKNGYIHMAPQGHVRKRKDFGDFLGSGQVPDGAAHLHPDANIKLPCILSSHSSMVQNGKVMEAPLSSGTISTNLVVDEKKLKVTSKSTPHPDTKYLDEVLSVPKMEEWSEYDDQEWLSEIKKPRIENITSMDGSPRVWDKAVLIDSADVYALPYVIPY